jgi:hypothetical protein
MQRTAPQRTIPASAVLGLLLVAVGAAVLFAREAGVNVYAWFGPVGWPVFVIAPGVVLLFASLVPTRPNGVGLAVAGAVVTTVGLILAYQSRTAHWNSWAYVWTLLPGAAGLGLIGYGLICRERPMVDRGLWLAGIAGVLFAAGAWFFEGVFAGQPRPQDIDWWPMGVIVIGAVVLAGGLLRPGEASSPASDTNISPPESTDDPAKPV